MKLLYFVGFIVIFLTSCVQDGKITKSQNDHPINTELKNQARSLFKEKLEDERSFYSYSSHTILYEIKAESFSLEQFNLYKDQILQKNDWIFFSKVDQAYVFCQGTRQLEMIPPQTLIGNKVLGGGDIGRQLEDTWNIIFRSTANGTLNKCYTQNR